MKFEFEVVDGKVNLRAEGFDLQKLVEQPGLLGEGLQALQKAAQGFLATAKMERGEEKREEEEKEGEEGDE